MIGRTEKKKTKDNKALLSFALTLALIAANIAPAQAQLDNDRTVSGRTYDTSNAAGGFLTSTPEYSAVVGNQVFTLRFGANGALSVGESTGGTQINFNPILVDGSLNLDASAAGNTITNLPISSFATNVANAGKIIAFDAAGAPTLINEGTANQVLTSNGPGQLPSFQAAQGGGGGGAGTVTSVASADSSITVNNGATTPDLSVAALQPNITTAENLANIATNAATPVTALNLGTATTVVAVPGALNVTGDSSAANFVAGSELRAAAGTATDPAINFTGDETTGLSSANAGEIVVSSAGNAVATFSSTGLALANNAAFNLGATNTISGGSLNGTAIENAPIGATTPSTGAFTTVTTNAGTSAAPSLRFAGDLTTGLSSENAGEVIVSAAGNPAATFNTNGTIIHGPLDARGGLITPAGQNTTFSGPVIANNGATVAGGLTISNGVNTATINLATDGTLQYTGTNNSTLSLNDAVLAETVAVLDTANPVLNLSYNPNAKQLEFVNFSPVSLIVDLVSRTADFGTGIPTLLADLTATDLVDLNLRITPDFNARIIQVQNIASTGFDAQPRRLNILQSGPVL